MLGPHASKAVSVERMLMTLLIHRGAGVPNGCAPRGRLAFDLNKLTNKMEKEKRKAKRGGKDSEDD